MVSDSKDITPRTIRAHNIAANAITTAKVGKKIIHTASADPTTAADAGTGYEVGSLWNNTSSGEIFVCTDSSEEDSVWRGQEGEGVNLPVQNSVGSTNYYFTGPGPWSGYAGTGSIIKLIFASDADSDTGYDFQTPAAPYDGVGHGSTTHMFQSGGTGALDSIQSVAYGSLADSADHGELVGGDSRAHSGLSSATEGFCVGEKDGPSIVDRYERFSFASPLTAAEVGEMNEIVHSMAGVSGTIQGKGWLCGGFEAPNNIVDTIQTAPFDAGEHNTADWGELSTGYGNNVGHNNDTTGWVDQASAGPGNQTNQTDNRNNFSLSSPGNGTDSGEAVATTYDRAQPGGISATHGYSVLGYNPGAGSDPVGIDAMEKFAFASPYNGTDIGEAPSNGYAGMGASD